MSRFMTSKLSNLVPYTPGEQPPRVSELIKLNTNESPFAPAPKIKEAICGSSIIEDLRLYSDPVTAELLREFSKYCNVESNNVIFGNGSDELLAFSFAAFGEKGFAFPDITYSFYKVFADLYFCDKQIVPLEEDFSIDVSKYKNIDKSVIIANPNAPTGIALTTERIEDLLNQNIDRLVIIDEAYVDFGGQSCISLTKKYDNLLVIGTFSKSRNLAGARLGYAIGNEKIIADLNTVKFSFNPYNINSLSMIAGIESVKDVDYFEECCSTIINNRENTIIELQKLGFTITESKANFLFASPPKITASEYFKKLRENNIVVRYFDAERIDNYVRITIGTDEQMKKLIETTKKILEEN